MATRKSKMSFAIKRFKGFWNQFKKSRRGMAGIIIIAFFVILGVFAPLIAPYAPIDPMKDVGKYPACGLFRGPKIAEMLCSPTWYKYVPWIHRGPTQLEEEFWINITKLGGLTFKQFGHLEEIATDDYIRLRQSSIGVPRVEVTFPNETEPRELVLSDEWWESRNPDIINVPDSFILPLYEVFGENITYATFKVTYTSATDLTENIELVPDFQFSSNPFEDGWNWTTYTDSINVTYNSVKGYNHDGCIEITCNPQPGQDESKVVLWKRFEYPYWVGPKSFWGHLSVLVEGMPGTRVKLTVTFQRDGGEPIPIVNYLKTASANYTHEKLVSTSQVVWDTTGSLSPEKTIFPTSGNYTLGIEVLFYGDHEASVYLDNFNIILYGNTFGILGTDNALGYPRDIFSTLVFGTRVSLIVGVLSALFSTMIGLFLGLVSGYMGGIIDEAIMRVADLFLVLPTLPLFIILVVALKLVYGAVSMWNIIIVITLFGWMGFARSVRSMVLSLRERPFVEAARAAGGGKFYIISRHILPNVFALVYITLATSVPGAIITEASLSWLGLGDPMIPSWGKLLYDFQSSGIAITRGLTEYWFWIFPACLSIALLATAFIMMGYALDEVLNPRLRMRR